MQDGALSRRVRGASAGTAGTFGHWRRVIWQVALVSAVVTGFVVGGVGAAEGDTGFEATNGTAPTGPETGSHWSDTLSTDRSGVSDARVSAANRQDGDAVFANDRVPVRTGDVARVPIALTGTDQARVYVGYDDQNFNVQYRVEDGNDDGVVTVEMNLYTLGRGDLSGSVDETAAQSLDTADGDDRVTDVRVDAVNGDAALPDPPLAPSSYEMNVTVDGVETDVAALRVTAPRIDGISSWTMPGSEFSSVSDAQDVRNSIDSGDLTEDEAIAQEDVLVWEIDSSSVYGAVERATDGDDYGAGFVEMLGRENTGGAGAVDDIDPALRDDFDFQVVQESAPGNRAPKELDLVDTVANDGLRVVPDQSNGELYVLLRTDRMNLDRGTPNDQGGSDEDLAVGQGVSYDANFTVTSGSGMVSSSTELLDGADVVDRSLQFDTNDEGIISVQPETGQSITGRTSVAPGTTLDVRLRGSDSSPFLEEASGTVGRDGTFEATVDLSERRSGSEFTATAQGFSTETDGVIGSASTAAVTFDDQTVRGGAVVVESVTMSDGGFVAVRQGSASGDIIGVSPYLEAGESRDIEIPLDSDLASTQSLVAMAHRDTNGNQVFDFPDADGSYTTDGSEVSDSATVSVQTPTPETTTPTTTTEFVTPTTTTDANPPPPPPTRSISTPTLTSSDGNVSGNVTTETDEEDEDEAGEDEEDDDGSGLPMVPLIGGAAAFLSLAGASVGLWQYRESGTDDDSPGPAAGAAEASGSSDQPAGGAASTDPPDAGAVPDQSTGTGQPTQPAGGPHPAQPGGNGQPTQPSGGPGPRQPSGREAASGGLGTHGGAGAASVAARFARQCPAVEAAAVSSDGTSVHAYEGLVAGDAGTQEATILALAPDHTGNERVRGRLLQAARRWRDISDHTNIATVYGLGADPRPWVAFDSGDRSLLSSLPTLDEQERVAVVTGVASAVQTGTSNTVTHGRLTPMAIHLTDVEGEPTPRATVSGWGIEQTTQHELGETTVTPYTAPEQLTADQRTGQTDMYQLGAVAYRVLTGEQPLATADSLAEAIEAGDVRPPSDVDPTLPEGVDDAIQRAMAVAPEERYDSPSDFEQAIIAAMG